MRQSRRRQRKERSSGGTFFKIIVICFALSFYFVMDRPGCDYGDLLRNFKNPQAASLCEQKSDKKRGVSSRETAASYLSSPYVHKVPANWRQPAGSVRVYATQECLPGIVRPLQSELAPEKLNFQILDLNSNPAIGNGFQSMLRAAKQENFSVPTYVVGDYIIFSNKDAARQIREISGR